MTTTRVYSSTDADAPVLTGEVGTFANVMKKCLVDGYGDKPPAGWSAPFSATGKVVLRNALAAGATGHYFRVQDDGADTYGARFAWIKAYVAMSDVDTPVGADVIPLQGQGAAAEIFFKSTTLSGTARRWMVWADELTVWYWVDADGAGSYGLYGLGDIESFVPADAYHSFVCGQTVVYHDKSSPICSLGGSVNGKFESAGYFDAGTSVVRMMRGYSGLGASISAGVPVFANGSSSIQSASGGARSPVTDVSVPGLDQNIYYPAYVAAEGSLRGRLRGIYYLSNKVDVGSNGVIEHNAAGAGSRLRCTCFYRRSKSYSYLGAVGIEEALAW